VGQHGGLLVSEVVGVQLDGIKSITDLSGGINSDASSFTLRDEEVLDTSRNVRIDPLGPIMGRHPVSRQGPVNGYQSPAGPVLNKPARSLHRYYRTDGAHRLLFTSEGYLLKIDMATISACVNIPPEGGAATDPAFTDTGQTDVDQAWEMLTYRDWVYMTTGSAFPRRTNGSFVYQVGRAAPTAAGTVVPAAGGALAAGTYYYRFTRVYGTLGESPMGAEGTVTLVGPNFQATVTVPAFTADQTGMRVYRSLVNATAGVGPYYLVTERAAAGAFLDNVAETALQGRLDQTLLTPPKAAFCELHQDRLWLAKLTEAAGTFYIDVMFSESGQPDTFRAQNRIRCPNPGGESLTGIRSYNGMLLLFTMNNVFAVVGTGIERGAQLSVPDYSIIKVARGPGAMSQRVIRELNGSLYFTNKRDVWRLTGNELQSISEFRVRRFLEANVNDSQGALAQGVATRSQYRVTFVQNGQANPGVTLIYDTQADGFLVDEGYEVLAYEYIAGDTDTPTLYSTWANLDSAQILKMDDENPIYDGDWFESTDLRPVVRRFRTKDFNLGAAGQHMQPLMLILEGRATEGTLAVTAFINKDKSTVPLGSFAFAAGVIWGFFLWGKAKWASAGQVLHHVPLPQAARSERISFQFEQTDLQPPFYIEHVGIGYKRGEVRSVPVGGATTISGKT